MLSEMLPKANSNIITHWDWYVRGFNEGAVLDTPTIDKSHEAWYSYLKGWNSVVLDCKLKNV